MAFNEDNGTGGVPVFDPIEAYSISMGADENILGEQSHSNSQVMSTGAMDGVAGVVDLGPIQTAGLSLTPVGPPASIHIDPPSENDAPRLPNVAETPEYPMFSPSVDQFSSQHSQPNSIPHPPNFAAYSARPPPPGYPQYGSNYTSGPPPSYEEYISAKQGFQPNLNLPPLHSQMPALGNQHLMHFPRPRIIPGVEPRFTKVVSGDKTIVYSQAIQPCLPDRQIPPGSSPPVFPSPGQSVSPGRGTPTVSPKPSPRKNMDLSVNQEFADIPGVNLKKANVDLNIYVNSLVPYCHPTFVNIDSYAERCLSCIVRKLRNNLPSLQTLIRTVRRREDDPMTGCIIIQRNKDCRITVARQGGPGTTSSKRIHPHLALLQLFVNPQVQNVNLLEPIDICSSPYHPGLNTGEICINPHHYTVVQPPAKPVNKSPGSTRKSPAKPRSSKKMNSEQNPLLQYLKSKENQEDEDDSDSDFLSDTSDSVDWENQWTNKSKIPEQTQHQQASEEDLLKEIKFLTLKRSESTKTCESREAPAKVLEKLKILDDLRCLFRGKFDLGFIQKSSLSSRPRAKTRKYLARQREKYEKLEVTRNIDFNSGAETQHPASDFSGCLIKVKQESVPEPAVPSIISVTGNAHSEFPENLNVKIKQEVIDEDIQDFTDEKRKKDDLVIQDLLDNIKESFETDLDMDLETFAQNEDEFRDQDFQQFSIANTFSMSGFTQSTSQDDCEDMKAEDAYDASSHSGTSDALLGGASSMDEGEDALPCIVSSWTVGEGEANPGWTMAEGEEGQGDSYYMLEN